MTSLHHVIVLLCASFHHVTSGFICKGTCYSGGPPQPNDITKQKALIGHSYKNITTSIHNVCLSHCINDCRCRACQMETSRCELLLEDKTSKAADFVARPGYVYYDLRQTMYNGPSSHMVQPSGCYNGCCRYQPCLHEGTCTEHCTTPKEKFTCNCPVKWYGKVCEKPIYYSCLDVLVTAVKPVTEDGVYTITRTDNNSSFPVYCAFNKSSTVAQAWSLIESFALSKNNLFKNKAFFNSYQVNLKNPNWIEYRLSLVKMKYIRSTSKMFRATCDFPNRTGIVTPDFLLAKLEQYDIISGKAMENECFNFVHLNVRNYDYWNGKAPIWHKKDIWHLHTDTWAKTCRGSSVPGSIRYEDAFGYYSNMNPKSRCTATTQWWLGEQK